MLLSFEDNRPTVGKEVFVAENATVIGDVTLGDHASVWFGAVVRGDMAAIRIGRGSNVQDCAVIHTAKDSETVIGDEVTIGHGAIVHACTVEDRCLIGMNAVVLDGAVIGEGSIIAAGAVVTGRTVVPPRTLMAGVPAKAVKTLPEDSLALRQAHAQNYAELAAAYRTQAADMRRAD